MICDTLALLLPSAVTIDSAGSGRRGASALTLAGTGEGGGTTLLSIAVLTTCRWL